jgi:hypothetical protein
MGDLNSNQQGYGHQLATRESIAQLIANNADSTRRLEIERDNIRYAHATENGRLEAYMLAAKEAKGIAQRAFFAGKDEVATVYRDFYDKMQQQVRDSNARFLEMNDVNQYLTELIQERRDLQHPDLAQ